MLLRSRIPYFAAGILWCGVILAQPQTPSGVQTPPINPDASHPPTGPSSTYPGAGPMDGSPSDMNLFSDKNFVKKTAEQRTTEVELAKLAEEKGSSDAVKEFSKRIVDDHAKTDQGLQTAATKVNIEVPSDLPRNGKKTRDKLAKLSGPDFDRAYAKVMLNNEKDNVESYRQAAQMGKVPEVKDYAAKTLPTVQQHQKMAEQLESSVKK